MPKCRSAEKGTTITQNFLEKNEFKLTFPQVSQHSEY